MIEASGAPEAVSQALDMVRDGGRVVVCGHYTDNGDVEIHPHFQINRKHVEIRGCWGSRLLALPSRGDLAARSATGFRGARWRAHLPARRRRRGAAAVERREVLKALIAPDNLREPS